MNPPTNADPTALPLRMLCVSRSEPRWTRFLVHMQETCRGELRLVWKADAKSALAELRRAGSDAMLLGEMEAGWRESAESLLGFLDAAQAVETAVPTIALLPMPDDRILAELYARNCEVCVSPRLWDSPALPAVVAGAIRRRQHWHDYQRFAVAHQRKLSREQADAETVLRLQHELLQTLQLESTDGPTAPSTWAERYDDLLKASILSGPKRLGGAIGELVDELAEASQRPLDVLALHVEKVQALSAGLGGRTSQHLVSRADLLALEVLAQLGDRYRIAALHAVA